MSGLPEDYNKSVFSKKNLATENLEYIIKNSKFKYNILSYNNEGIIDFDDIQSMLLENGKSYYHKSLNYKRFKSDDIIANKNTTEYLHILIK